MGTIGGQPVKPVKTEQPEKPILDAKLFKVIVSVFRYLLIAGCTAWCYEGRSQTIDSSLLQLYRQGLDSIVAFNAKYSQFLENFLISRGPNDLFCYVNGFNEEEGDRLLEFYLRARAIPKYVLYRFYVEEFWCLTSEQRKSIRSSLNGSLKPCDPYFHQLASLYQADFLDFFASHKFDPADLRIKILYDLQYRGRIREETQFLINNMAALANFGETQWEDTLLNIVHDVYYQITSNSTKEAWGRHALFSFYTHIVSAIAILNSRSSVRKTLYLLDEKDSGYSGDDVGRMYFAEQYFYIVIEPKLKISARADVILPVYGGNMDVLKAQLSNDDSIWFDFIR